MPLAVPPRVGWLCATCSRVVVFCGCAVTCFIVGGNANGASLPAFALDSASGNLTVASHLDFETSPVTIPVLVELR